MRVIEVALQSTAFAPKVKAKNRRMTPKSLSLTDFCFPQVARSNKQEGMAKLILL